MQEAVVDFVMGLVARTEAVLGEELLAMSLVGSLATGDARPTSSDIDLFVVIDRAPDGAREQLLAEGIVSLGLGCPWKGLEYVVYQADVVRAPTYPLPYTLNINAGPGREPHVTTGGDSSHWFLLDAAMARQNAIALRGPPLRDLIAEPLPADVLRAIHDALAWHAAHDRSSPHAVLNACRSWRWMDTGRWTSKSEAARWAFAQASGSDDAAVIADALAARYARITRLDEDRVAAFLARVSRMAERDDE